MGRLLLLSMFFVSLSMQAQECPTVEDTTQSFCAADMPTISDLQADGVAVQWYSETGELLATETILTEGVSYFAGSAYCETQDRVEVQVQLDPIAIAGSLSHIYLCSDSDPVNLQELIWPISDGGSNHGSVSNPEGYFEGHPFSGTHIIDPSLYELGTYQFKYIVNTACGSDDTRVKVYIIDSPDAGEPGIITLLEDNGEINLNSYLSEEADLGGKWMDEEGNELSEGYFNSTTHNSGNYTYTVSQTIIGSGDQVITCEDSATFEVIVHTEEQEKVTICHKGKTLEVNKDALQAHLDHGDDEGACIEQNSKTVVSPNPSRGDINFTNESAAILKVTFLNFDGQVVKQIEPSGSQKDLKVDISDFRKGIYFAEVITSSGKEVLRVIRK